MPPASSGKEVLHAGPRSGDAGRSATRIGCEKPTVRACRNPDTPTSMTDLHGHDLGRRRLKAGVGPGPTTEWGGRVNGEWLRRSPSTRFLDWVEKLLTTRPRDRPVATTSGAMVLEAASEPAESPEASFLGPPKKLRTTSTSAGALQYALVHVGTRECALVRAVYAFELGRRLTAVTRRVHPAGHVATEPERGRLGSDPGRRSPTPCGPARRLHRPGRRMRLVPPPPSASGAPSSPARVTIGCGSSRPAACPTACSSRRVGPDARPGVPRVLPCIEGMPGIWSEPGWWAARA